MPIFDLDDLSFLHFYGLALRYIGAAKGLKRVQHTGSRGKIINLANYGTHKREEDYLKFVQYVPAATHSTLHFQAVSEKFQRKVEGFIENSLRDAYFSSAVDATFILSKSEDEQLNINLSPRKDRSKCFAFSEVAAIHPAKYEASLREAIASTMIELKEEIKGLKLHRIQQLLDYLSSVPIATKKNIFNKNKNPQKSLAKILGVDEDCKKDAVLNITYLSKEQCILLKNVLAIIIEYYHTDVFISVELYGKVQELFYSSNDMIEIHLTELTSWLNHVDEAHKKNHTLLSVYAEQELLHCVKAEEAWLYKIRFSTLSECMIVGGLMILVVAALTPQCYIDDSPVKAMGAVGLTSILVGTGFAFFAKKKNEAAVVEPTVQSLNSSLPHTT